ncbi:MAG TPA: EAL domain-containing protein, partial [Steroidobacteraceae bacterium]|nr:EAL domain-containing protein [Steroidobacteraceae bacterium]
AETACKAAKDRGRNRVELFADSDQSLMRRFDDMGVFRRVVEALGAGGFTLFAQPIVPLRNRKRPTSYELLVRMNGTDGSALAPDMFFSAATRYQLLPKLDRWVLNETMKQLQPYAALLAEWNISFAINISGQSLGDSEFTDFARSTLKGSGIDPKWITLEITESAAIGNLEIAKKFISRMTALGCRFALDDFGTGLSSLAYLKELAVSSIKIDGVFVRDLLSSSRSEAMIEAVMTIAHELRLDTVAEFVESQEISERLMAFGVTHGQGYAFGRPEPLKALLASLAAGRQPDQDLRKQAGS